MNLENIKNGMRIKNYKEMCSLLGEEVLLGNSKVSQIKEWERYFEYHKQGHAFVIDSIFEIPLDKNNVKGLNSKYSKDIQPLILDLLAQKENNGVVTLSCSQLFRKLQMVNTNYTIGRNDIPRLSELIKVDKGIIYDFYSYTHTNLKNIIETALNSLQDQSLIKWSKEITVCEEKVILHLNEVGTPKVIDGNVECHTSKVFRPATDEEIKIILRNEKMILDTMRLENKSKVVAKGLWDKFTKLVNIEVKNSCNIVFYYDSYKIINNQDIILLELQKLGRIEKVDRFNSLNNKICESISKTIETKHKNSKVKVDDFECAKSNDFPSDLNFLHAKSDFVKQSEKVKRAIIPRKSRVLKFSEDDEK